MNYNKGYDVYTHVRHQLDKFGYYYPLLPDSLPLTEKLVADLSKVTEQLKHYKDKLQERDKDCNLLEVGLEPYKQDNARLVAENNSLHNKLIELHNNYKDTLNEEQQDVKQLHNEIADLKFINNQTLDRVRDLEAECLEKNNKILCLTVGKTLVIQPDGTTQSHPSNTAILEISEPLKISSRIKNRLWEAQAQADDIKVVNIVEMMEKRTCSLVKQLEDLRKENERQQEVIAGLKRQLNLKDKEVERVKGSLEGGRPLGVLMGEYCSPCQQKGCHNRSLKTKLDLSIEKQHEAMTLAVQLEEKNKHLECEMKEMYKFAMKIEEDLVKKSKNNKILEDILKDRIREIEDLEKNAEELKRKLEAAVKRADSLLAENKVLDENMEAARCERKAMNDKINQLVAAEAQLKTDVSQLAEENKRLSKDVDAMEHRLLTDHEAACDSRCRCDAKKPCGVSPPHQHRTSPQGKVRGISPNKKKSLSPVRRFKTSGDYLLTQVPSISLLDKLEQERTFYHNECRRLRQQINNQTAYPTCSADDTSHATRIQSECTVSRSRNCCRNEPLQSKVDKLERELATSLADVVRLQEECDSLRGRIKVSHGIQIGDHSRLEKIIKDNDETIRKLETERWELINSQGMNRVQVTSLEETCDKLRQQVRSTQAELAQLNTLYTQLKFLQEQTDRSLSLAQGRVTQLEEERGCFNDTRQELDKSKRDLEEQISHLKKDLVTMRTTLTTVEKEKDELLICLDDKTEKVARLEADLKRTDAKCAELTDQLGLIQKKLNLTRDDGASREYAFRNLEHGLELLKQELADCERHKEALIQKNRTLQDNFALALQDCSSSRRQLDASRLEVENMKKQLQLYCSEVKRVEELLFTKDCERDEMLDHFKSLNHEATALESNNHTLETEMENTRGQLHTVNSKLSDLEQQVASRDDLISSYEKQISGLKMQGAELEMKLYQQRELRQKAEDDVAALKEHCVAVNSQREVLNQHVTRMETDKSTLSGDIQKLSGEYEELLRRLEKEQSKAHSLETSLSDSRQQTLEHKVSNSKLQQSVQALRLKLDDLTKKLECEDKERRRYQTQCDELSQQVGKLRRELTDVRFQHATEAVPRIPQTSFDGDRQVYFEDDVSGMEFFKAVAPVSCRDIVPLVMPEDSPELPDTPSSFDLVQTYVGGPSKPTYEVLPKKSETDTSELSSLPEDTASKEDILKALPQSTTANSSTQQHFRYEGDFSRTLQPFLSDEPTLHFGNNHAAHVRDVTYKSHHADNAATHRVNFPQYAEESVEPIQVQPCTEFDVSHDWQKSLLSEYEDDEKRDSPKIGIDLPFEYEELFNTKRPTETYGGGDCSTEDDVFQSCLNSASLSHITISQSTYTLCQGESRHGQCDTYTARRNTNMDY